MEQSKVTTKVVHDTRRVKQNGTYPLKLRVTFQRTYKDYRLGIDLTEEDFRQMVGGRNRNDRLRETRLILQAKESEANDIVRKLPVFSFKNFEKVLFEGTTQKAKQSIYHLMEEYIGELKTKQQVSTSSCYQTSLGSFRSFAKNLRYDQIDKEFLEGYMQHMLREGKSTTTISIYLRCFRTIVNRAIEAGYIHRSDYPFSKTRFQIPGGRNIKKALKISQIEKLFNYPTVSGTNEDRAKDIWLFSYLCNGMNIKDICRLRYRDINKSTITFIRAKTERTSRGNLAQIVVKPVKEAFDIINKWGNLEHTKDNFVFPFLNDSRNAFDERRIVQNVTRNVNKHMARIGKALGFDGILTTYVARHSYSTVLKRSNEVSIDYISESLGHKDRKTTQHYLDSFEEEELERYGKLLVAF
ncbi:site-specific integrase [Dyadobacter crusticola]|uniref:site-specific integrase n=1 Tax=Dyadobacter crusticola TaxID=292407 RepID=UPI0004E1E756|nr:site-specific integrase [Dyadobacter crusticola]